MADSSEPPANGAEIAAPADRQRANAVEQHLSGLPGSYARQHAPDEIERHIALIERAAGGTAIDHARANGGDRLTVATVDRSGLLELLAGTLTVRSVRISGATAYTRADGVVIDMIDVAPKPGTAVHDAYWREVCDDLVRAITGGRAPDQPDAPGHDRGSSADRPRIPTVVYIHNVPSNRFSKVEVNAADRPGLLYAITRALREQSVNVHLAQVETIGALAVDTFYVVDEAGHRIEAPNAIERLRAAVTDRIETLIPA